MDFGVEVGRSFPGPGWWGCAWACGVIWFVVASGREIRAS